MGANPNFAEVGALIGDPARANMLAALMDGRALPAGELAFLARVLIPARVAEPVDADDGDADDGDAAAVRRAARHAVLAGVIAATVSGVVFDLGVAFYTYAAAAVATTAPGLRKRHETRHAAA